MTLAVPWGEGSKTRLSFANKGSGIRFGGDGKRDGIKNRAYGNVIRDNSQYGIQMTRNPQSLFRMAFWRRKKRPQEQGAPEVE